MRGKLGVMICVDAGQLEFCEAWQPGDKTARWRSGSGHSPSTGAEHSGSSLLEIEPGQRLPRHTDSAEETIVVLSGTAEVHVDREKASIGPGSLAVVPKCVPHEVRNTGDELLRFVAIYAEPDVVTRYEREIEPDGSRERHTVS